MSLFGTRRRRHPNLNPTALVAVNPAAATAALSAFSRRESPPSLSEAAAAAALRARPHTPTNVAEVQTKRTMRRSASMSFSHGASSPHPPPLQRSGSSGSMTERTFRSPSPHRPPGSRCSASSGGGHRYTQSTDVHVEATPPVPAIPQNAEMSYQKEHRRTTSLGITSPPVRVASQRLKEGKGTWFGAPSVGDLANIRTSHTMMTAAVSQPDPNPRPESRSSINFSYPSRVRVGSPPSSPVAQERAPDGPELEPQSQSRQPTQTTATAQPESKRVPRTFSASQKSAQKQQPPSTVLAASSPELVYDPNSRRMVPKAELMALEQSILDPETTKAQTRKKKPAKAGSHLAKGTVSRTKGSAISTQDRSLQSLLATPPAPPPARIDVPPMSPDGLEAQEPEVKTSLTLIARAEDGDNRYAQPAQTVLSPSNYLPEVVDSPPPIAHKSQTGYVLGKQPSIVDEEVEMDAGEQSQPRSLHAASDALDSVIMRQYINQQPTPPKIPQQPASDQPSRLAVPPAELAAELPKAGSSAPVVKDEVHRSSPEPKKAGPGIGRTATERAHSSSPVRIAHFGPVQTTLSVKHSPPARSVSPMKSALKQHSPPRSTSSVEDGSDASSVPISREREETLLPRKKSARVSFDDRDTTVVGHESPASSPPSQNRHDQTTSPPGSGLRPTRRHWFSNIRRSKKKESSAFDDDEVMKPRPALPSFDSIREQKPPREREEVERPLVRPVEASYSPSLPDSPSLQSIPAVVDGNNGPQVLGQSSDHAIGAIIAHEHTSRIPANISRFREPLPPVVTSREDIGYGYSSSSSNANSSESDDELVADTPTLSTEQSKATTIPETEQEIKPLNGSTTASNSEAHIAVVTSEPPKAVAQCEPATTTTGPTSAEIQAQPPVQASIPSVSISEASPLSEENKDKPTKPQKLFVPGEFPTDESSEESAYEQHDVKPPMGEVVPPHPERPATFEPVQQKQEREPRSTRTLGTITATLVPVIESYSDSETEGSSIYSDAYEDLSDIEGLGFQSLDAAVESPITTSTSKIPFSSNSSAHQQPQTEQTSAPASTPAAAVNGPSKQQGAPVSPAAPTVPISSSSPLQNDWEAAKAYWKSLTIEKRAQLEKEAREEAGAEADLEEPAALETKKPRRKKSIGRREAEKKAIREAQEAQQQGNSDRVYMIKPGTRMLDDSPRSSMRMSMRGSASAPAAIEEGKSLLRRTMRGCDSSTLQPQHESPAHQPWVQPRARPKSATVDEAGPSSTASQAQSWPPPAAAGAVKKKDRATHGKAVSDTGPAQERGGAAQPMSSLFLPALKRKGSTSRESSFRRSTTRRGSEGSFSFRKTLRNPPEAQYGRERDRDRDRSSIFSLGSFSPSVSIQRSPPPPVSTSPRMRTSMRDSAGLGRKGNDTRAKGGGGGVVHLPSFGLKSKKFKGKSKASRFGDSSDEDDGASRDIFRSRFDDSSSDEGEIAPPPIPVPKSIPITLRGASITGNAKAIVPSLSLKKPRRQVQAVREEEEEAEKAEEEAEGHAGLPNSRAERAAAMTAESSRPATRQVATPKASLPAPMRAASPQHSGSGVGSMATSRRSNSLMSAVLSRRRSSKNSGMIQRGELMDSAARRDTALERSPLELSAMRSASSAAAAAAGSQPRLQKRTASLPVISTRSNENWPLASAGAGRPEESEEEQAEGIDGMSAQRRKKEGAGRRTSSAGNLLSLAAASGSRPGSLSRRSLSYSDATGVAGPNYGDGVMAILSGGDGEKPRKKKFSALRRMFRLDD